MLRAGLLVLLVVACTCAQKLVFSDDFNELDCSIWKHELTMGGGGNWEFEYYVNNRSNSYVNDGVLYIKPTLTSDTIGEPNVQNGYTMDMWGSGYGTTCTGNAFYGCERISQGSSGGNVLNPIQSARLRTAESFSFKYGRVEVRAKLPLGDWLWPAIWLLPKYSQYGNWPASGEIDIMESRGNVGYPRDEGPATFGSTLHWGPFFPEDPWPQTHATYTIPTGDLHSDFHIYGLLWNATHLITYIDAESNVVLSVDTSSESFWQKGPWAQWIVDNPWRGRGNNAPFDQEFYLILNLAVGGVAGYFPDGVDGKPWTNADPHAVNAFYSAINSWYPTWKGEDAALQVDYVRVWQ